MAVEKVTIDGNGIRDKHTHYEGYPFVGNSMATVIIRGDIAEDFRKKYGCAIWQCHSFEAEVSFHRNEERLKECQDPFLSPKHIMGSIDSLDDIVDIQKEDPNHKFERTYRLIEGKDETFVCGEQIVSGGTTRSPTTHALKPGERHEYVYGDSSSYRPLAIFGVLEEHDGIYIVGDEKDHKAKKRKASTKEEAVKIAYAMALSRFDALPDDGKKQNLIPKSRLEEIN